MGTTTRQEITTRQLATSDLSVVMAIEREAFYDPWRVEMWLDEINANISLYEVIEENEKVVGFAGCWLIAGEAQVTRVAIAMEHRGKGLGKKLTQALVAKAWAQEAEAVTLEVRKSNLAAQKVYETCGFKSKGIRPKYYQDNKEDAVIMWLYAEAER